MRNLPFLLGVPLLLTLLTWLLLALAVVLLARKLLSPE